MGKILNSAGQLALLKGRYEEEYFVDKSEILEKLNGVIGKVNQQYICITRPRRFGKTVMTNLISSYYAEVWDTLEDIFYETEEKFIFILDEWDSFFHSDFYTEKGAREYLMFLKNLLKDKPYVELAYMTGVLPVKKYSSGSELNTSSLPSGTMATIHLWETACIIPVQLTRH